MKSTTKVILVAVGLVVLTLIVALVRSGGSGAGKDTFRNSYVSGYEGDFTELSYELSYPKNQFLITGEGRKVQIEEVGNGNIHTITFFWNGAAGFASAADFWVNQNQEQCVGCTGSTSTLKIRDVHDVISFVSGDGKEEWFVGEYEDFFVVVKLVVPREAAKGVVESMRMRTEAAEPPEEVTNPIDTIALKVFFMNQKLAPVEDCDEVVAVTRVVPRTPAVARAALELLLAGPTRADLGEGYTSSIPSGSMLNSLAIVDGEARADFNATTESGGGSCSMRARTEQIRQTLLQFPTVKSVRLSVEGRTADAFQP